MEITNAEIYDNTAISGGGLYISSEDATLDGVRLLRNSALSDGGGIYGSGKLTITGNTVIGGSTADANTAGNSGGGIYFSANTNDLTITDGEISYNQTKTGNGGGVYVYGDSTLTGVSIHHNAAEMDGGGVYADGYSYSPTHYRSMTITGGTEIAHNTAGRDGGGLSSTIILALEDGLIAENMAGRAGGGIYSPTGALTGEDENGTTTEIPSVLVAAAGTVRNNTALTGGGIYAVAQGITPIPTMLRSTPALNNNVPTVSITGGADGGGIYGAAGAYENTEDWVNPDDGSAGYYETAHNVYDTSITVEDGGAVTGNTTGENGGGIYGSADITLTDGTVSGNGAGGDGGGIYGPQQTWLLYAHSWGEWDSEAGEYIEFSFPIYYDTGAAVTISGSSAVSGNTAGANGGGVHSGGAVNVTGGSVTGNTARASGGGIFTITGETIAGAYERVITKEWIVNEYYPEYSYWECTTTFESTTLTLPGTVVTLSGGTVGGNTADADGGGVYLAADADENALSATLNASGSAAFTNNHATNEGGAIYTENVADYDALTASDYQNITTDAGTAFTGNTADAAHTPPAIASSYTNIGFSSVSLGISHPINNYDINYRGTPQPIYYTVTYDPNGGTGTVYYESVADGTTYTVRDNTDANLGYTRSGYTFDGWNTAALGNGTPYAAGNTFTVSGSVTLYAQWDASTGEIIKITLDMSDVYWWVPANDNEGSQWQQGTGYNEVSPTSPEGDWQATEKGKVYAPTYTITNNSDFDLDVSVYSFKTDTTDAVAGDMLNLNIKWKGIENTTTPLVDANTDLPSGTNILLTTASWNKLTGSGGVATFSFAGTWTGTYRNNEIPYKQTMVLNFKKAP